jgi:hypothetical protein
MRVFGEHNGAGPALGGGPGGGGQTVVRPVTAADPAPNFSLSLELRGDGTAVLALAGELDLFGSAAYQPSPAHASDRDDSPEP